MSTRSFSERAGAVAALALLAAVSGGCQRRADSPEVQAARAAVARYDERLPAAFRARDQSLLGDAASPAETDRVGDIIAGLASKGRLMIARLVDFREERATARSPDQVVIDTTETWRYEHRPLDAADQPVASQERTYRMSYQVGRHRGVWQVEHAAVDEEAAVAPSK